MNKVLKIKRNGAEEKTLRTSQCVLLMVGRAARPKPTVDSRIAFQSVPLR